MAGNGIDYDEREICHLVGKAKKFRLNLGIHESESRSVMSDSLRLYSPWNSPGQNTGVGLMQSDAVYLMQETQV